MVNLGELNSSEIVSYKEDLLRNLASRTSEKKDQILKDLGKLSETLIEDQANANAFDISDRMNEVAEKLKEKK